MEVLKVCKMFNDMGKTLTRNITFETWATDVLKKLNLKDGQGVLFSNFGSWAKIEDITALEKRSEPIYRVFEVDFSSHANYIKKEKKDLSPDPTAPILVGYSSQPINAEMLMERTGLNRKTLEGLERDYGLFLEW